jgi:hypothetical protein
MAILTSFSEMTATPLPTISQVAVHHTPGFVCAAAALGAAVTSVWLFLPNMQPFLRSALPTFQMDCATR